jgi:hypothetical protein
MIRFKQLRLGGLAVLAATVITILTLVWSGLAAPVSPPRAGPNVGAGAGTVTGGAAAAPWGHDELTPLPTTGARSVIEPRLPAYSVPLATQRPFVTPPARSAPPTLPPAYAAAMPPDPALPAPGRVPSTE